MDLKEALWIIKNTPDEFNIAQHHVAYFEAKCFLEGYEQAIKEAAEIAAQAFKDGKNSNGPVWGVHDKIIRLLEK